MTELGFDVVEYGLNTYLIPVRRKLVKLDDPGSILLRYAPDFFCIGERFTFFVEAKSKKGNSNYFSYNLNSLNLGRALARMGIRILVVFEASPFNAEWIQDLPILRICEGSASGSGKSFVLIREAELPSLGEILQESEIRNGSSSTSILDRGRPPAMR